MVAYIVNESGMEGVNNMKICDGYDVVCKLYGRLGDIMGYDISHCLNKCKLRNPVKKRSRKQVETK